MKYQSEHGFMHPVLNPESDHYPNGKLRTKVLKPRRDNGRIFTTVEFDIEEPTLERLIAEERAVCIAMLYCRATLHQQTFRAEHGALTIEGSTDSDLLRDAVEIHPLVVANETIEELNTSTADPFYQDTKFRIYEGEPLATDRGWHFSLNVDSLPLQSIFQFIPDQKLTGPSRIETDPNQTYIGIRINAGQFQKLNITRQQGLTIPSIFNSALVEAIHSILDLDPDEQIIVPGWVDTIRKQAAAHNVEVTKQDANPFELAQILLRNPFQNLPNFQIKEAEDQSE